MGRPKKKTKPEIESEDAPVARKEKTIESITPGVTDAVLPYSQREVEEELVDFDGYREHVREVNRNNFGNE